MSRLGVFGGTFNPPHIGHINSIDTVRKSLGLDNIRIVPAAQNPLKPLVDGPSSDERLEMVRKAFQDYGDSFIIDDREIQRGGLSYTVDTLESLQKENPEDELFFIIGMDKFDELPEWKDMKRILSIANLVVTTRPGTYAPSSLSDFPEEVAEMVEEFTPPVALLNTGRMIHFIQLKDVDISGTELRKRLRSRQQMDRYLPLAVENYIRERDLYQPIGSKISDFESFTRFCAERLFERKAIDVLGFDLRNMNAPTEFTIIASGTSTRHTQSLAELLQNAVKAEYGVLPQAIEGSSEGRWIVLDYGSLIVHLFYDFVRQEYSLESLWKEGIDMGLKDPSESKS